MRFKIFGMTVVVGCLTTWPQNAASQALPRDLQAWKLEYSVGGGFYPMDYHVTLTQAGELTVRKFRDQVLGRAPDELMAKVTAFLKVARIDRRAPSPQMPDARYASLTLSTATRQYELQYQVDIAKLLAAAGDDALKQALVGVWRQSSWTLCKPVPQLGASDVDPPIGVLVFRQDGVFSVTWPGGGARTTGPGHVTIPDYRGRYSIIPETGSIQMRIESGIFIPRDFSGDGAFRIDMNKLVLRNVWLGTRQAKQKPDICELTFAREAETPGTATR